MNYYNEIEKFPAQWLRNLSDAGHISKGYVDERSIIDVKPEDLRGYKQCHFFAGIGVWSHALRLAGWSDDKEVWTGSCPCQPFSAAGKRGGTADARHLWPEWFRLIKECRPRVIFGEQVASKDGLAWLDIVYADLEAEGYTVGAVDICAAGFGAPHIRQRLFFVAELGDTKGKRIQDTTEQEGRNNSRGASTTRIVADTTGGRLIKRESEGEQKGHIGEEGEPRIVADTGNGTPRSTFGKGDNEGRSDREQDDGNCVRYDIGNGVSSCCMGDSDLDCKRGEGGGCCCQEEGVQEVDREEHLSPRKSGRTGDGRSPVDQPDSQGLQGDEFGGAFQEVRSETRDTIGEPSPTNGFWADAVWIPCRDGKARATQSRIFPLAHGVASRVGRLRAYGNAIVAPVAQEFIMAYMEVRGDT